MSKKEMLKKNIIKDIQAVQKLFQDEKGENSLLTRDYYRKYGKYSDAQILSVFSSFTEARQESLKDTIVVLEYKKKIQQLQNENLKLLQENKSLLSSSVTEESLLNLYEECLLKERIITISDDYKFLLSTQSSKTHDAISAILMLSDFHLGEVIKGDEIHNINEFNVTILFARLKRVLKYFVKYCKKFSIGNCYILFLGDLFSGSHHPELMKTNECTDVDSIFILQEFLISELLGISEHFNSIKIHFLVGNHGRIVQGKPEFKKAGIMNYEYILAKQLYMYFNFLQKDIKLPKIQVYTTPSLFDVITVADRKFLITHGHILSNSSKSFAGIPYYGLSMSASKLDGAFKEIQQLNFSDILCGHLHCTSKVKTPIGNIYINGSLIGVSEFSLYNIKVIGYPEQTLLVVENGQVNAEITLRGA